MEVNFHAPFGRVFLLHPPSPDMQAKYFHPVRMKAFFISPAAGIKICLQDGRFCRDDALRLLRQSFQKVRCRSPEQNDEPSQRDLHKFFSFPDPPDIFYKPPLLFVLDHLLRQLREGHPRLSHAGEGSPDLFPDGDALCAGLACGAPVSLRRSRLSVTGR